MSDFHLETEISSISEEKDKIAQAFELGLRHCATDPLIRLKMILGETYAEYATVVETLAVKLSKENEAVREMAAKVAFLYREIYNTSLASVQQTLLCEALDLLPEKPE